MISLGINGLGIAKNTGSRPSLNLDFINSQIFDPRITFTRASTARKVNANGLIEVVASNSPRIDFDPATDVCKGLLIEEQRTNLLTYSENFDNAAWQGTATAFPNDIASPDGAITADTLSSAVNTDKYQTVTSLTAGVQYTASIFVKAGTVNQLRLREPNSNIHADINLTLNTISVTSGVGTATLVNYGNNWFRATLSYIQVGAIALVTIRNNSAITGDWHVWGAQLEAGSFATSYIPTVASQVTRSADNAVMTGTNFSSWYNQTEGTVLVDYDMETSTNQDPSAWYIDDGVLNRFGHSVSFGLKNCNYDSLTNNVVQLYLSLGAMPTTVLSAYAYKENDFVGCANGGTVLTDTSGVQPTVNRLQIGGRLYGAFLNGHISKLSYYPKRLTNSELQALTTG